MASGDYVGQLRSRPQKEKEIDTSQGVLLPRPLWLWEEWTGGCPLGAHHPLRETHIHG